jgi:O-acetylserine/cysteine efflux transporter
VRFRDAILAALTSVIWGLAFVATKLGLEGFSAAELAALRFLIGCLPALLVPRPRIAWPRLAAIGMTLFCGQFLLLFFAFKAGMPAGLASVTQQSQAFFTVLLAATFLREVPSLRQCCGMTVAFAGLALIGLTVGGDLTTLALGLALAGAFSWAIGNVLVKRTAEVPVLSLVVWASLVPPLPALLFSAVFDRHLPIIGALAGASWPSLGSALYLGTIATFVAYAIWGDLLQRYPAALVTPFALLAPCTGVLSSTLTLGEVFEPVRYVGMAFVLAGLAITIFPGRPRTPNLRRAAP